MNGHGRFWPKLQPDDGTRTATRRKSQGKRAKDLSRPAAALLIYRQNIVGDAPNNRRITAARCCRMPRRSWQAPA
jgi:hypothetical protein